MALIHVVPSFFYPDGLVRDVKSGFMVPYRLRENEWTEKKKKQLKQTVTMEGDDDLDCLDHIGRRRSP